MRNDFGIEQRPHAVLFDATHKNVGNPVRDVEVVRAARLVSGVIAQFEKFFEIGVPGFEIYTARALPLSALVHSHNGRVQRLEPWRNTIRLAIGGANQRSALTHTMVGNADTTGILRKQRNIRVLGIDCVKLIERRIE
jgi:hypothetical protein